MMHQRSVYKKTLIIVVVFTFIAVSAGTGKPGQIPIETRIARKADSLYEQIVKIRRHIHQHPELSGQEVRTAGVIAKRLKSLGLEVKTNVGGYGVVGILRGSPDGPVVAYRADIDAIPQNIREDVPFKSETPGVSHGCGHDVHAAVGLGVAQVLASLKEDLPGTVKFIFQPAEENFTGAKKMIEDGVLENPTPDIIFALHVFPLETGKMITNPGVGLPGYDFFSVTLTGGKELDAAAQTCLNAIHSLSTVNVPITRADYHRLTTAILEKNGFINKFVWANASVDVKNSSDQKKIITGFFKASDADTYKEVRRRLHKTLSDLAPDETSFEVAFTLRLPDMFCDKEIAIEAITPLEAILGEQAVITAYSSVPFFSEDFALYLQKIRGAMFFLGASNTAEGIYSLPHHPEFSVDGKAILVGVKGMANVIIHYLFKLKKKK